MEQASRARLPVRSLYLGVTVVFWLVVAGSAIGIPAAVGGALLSDHPLSIHATVSAEALGKLPGSITVVDRVPVSIPIDHLSGAQIVVSTAALALACVAFVIALWELRRIVRSVRDRDPFATDNVRRLRTLGLLLLVGYPVAQYLTAAVYGWILRTQGPRVATAQIDIHPFSLGAVFGGLCLLVLAEVFAHGIELREDVEGTV